MDLPMFASIIERADTRGIVYETIRSGTVPCGAAVALPLDDGTLQHFIFVGNMDARPLFDLSVPKIVLDLRDARKFGTTDVYDVVLMHGGGRLRDIINRELPANVVEEFNERQRQVGANMRALRTTKIDMSTRSMLDVLPPWLTAAHYRIRATAAWLLFCMTSPEERLEWTSRTSRLATVLYSMEDNGVHVRPDVVSPRTASERSFLAATTQMARDGVVPVRFRVGATKTGRIHPDRHTWPFASIPRTSVRAVVTSRFDGGSIASMDFNASDYRCLVADCGDPVLTGKYAGCDDFHSRTVELILGTGSSDPLRRKVIKDFTYTSIYGGSRDTLSAKTGLSMEKTRALLTRLDALLAPITEMRHRLHLDGVRDGHIDVRGMSVPVAPGDHAGKVMALYGQTLSSIAFGEALIAATTVLATTRSLPMFPVHDELVIDAHPDDVEALEDVRRAMETASASITGTPLRVNMRIGPNYWELT